MAYIGIQSQISRNNNWSIFLLASFPILILWLSWLFFYFLNYWEIKPNIQIVNLQFLEYFPWIVLSSFIWFFIAYFSHSSMIKSAVSSHNIKRKENPNLYNLLENLCISQWMRMPKLQVINDNSLNAFASWINEKTYTITLSKWIIEKLDKKELETVIAHELTHIKNKDTRLLIISIIFVWIFSFLAQIFLRSLSFSGNRKKSWASKLIIIWFVLSIIWYFFSVLIRFSISRKREYLADAGSVEMTKNPKALASALKKISKDSLIEALNRKDLASAFIENPKPVSNLINPQSMFSTHPPIKNRIKFLENL